MRTALVLAVALLAAPSAARAAEVSITLPPPRATTKSQWLSRIMVTHCSTIS